MKKPIERVLTLTVPLKTFDALGYKFDADSHDDVWHSGYTTKDIRNFSEPKGMDGVNSLFPAQVCMALEDAERDTKSSAVVKANVTALENALELIDAPMEYLADNGEMVSVRAFVVTAKVDLSMETVELTINNPEHLINGIVYGIGYFAPELSAFEKASLEDIKASLHNITDYFEVFGEHKPKSDLDSRYSPDIDDAFYASLLQDRIAELTAEEVVESIVEAFDNVRVDSLDEAIEVAAILTKVSQKDLRIAVKEYLKQQGESLLKQANAI